MLTQRQDVVTTLVEKHSETGKLDVEKPKVKPPPVKKKPAATPPTKDKTGLSPSNPHHQ
jgi:hypothetical protein